MLLFVVLGLFSLGNAFRLRSAVSVRNEMILHGEAWSLQTAQYLATLSAIVYCNKQDIEAWKCSRCDRSLRPPQVFIQGSENFQAMVTDNGKDKIFVVFKGTEPLSWSQWANNLDFLQTDQQCSGCKVHSGFWKGMMILKPNVDAAFNSARQRLPTAAVIVTGHSLGAAMASLYALQLVLEKNIKPIFYSFGGPRVGNQAWSRFFEQKIDTAYRINNDRDIVPHVPPQMFNYRHAGVLYFCLSDVKCTNMAGQENDNGLLHTSILDHGKYLGVNYLEFVGIGFQPLCKK